MDDETDRLVRQGATWVQYDIEHKHRYRCSKCDVLAYRYPRHKKWSVFTCSHTTMQTQGDGSEKRRSACDDVATEWHADSPYCLKHKPIPRGMDEERGRLAMAKREDARAQKVYIESISRMKRDSADIEARTSNESLKIDDTFAPLPAIMLL